jgi:hypothetical protein
MVVGQRLAPDRHRKRRVQGLGLLKFAPSGGVFKIVEQSQPSQEGRLRTLRPGVGKVHHPDRAFDRTQLRVVLRTRARLTRPEGLGGGDYGESKGHQCTGAVRQVPNLFFTARIDVPHKRY